MVCWTHKNQLSRVAIIHSPVHTRTAISPDTGSDSWLYLTTYPNLTLSCTAKAGDLVTRLVLAIIAQQLDIRQHKAVRSFLMSPQKFALTLSVSPC